MYLKNSIRNFQKVVSNGDKRCGTLKDDVGTVKDGTYFRLVLKIFSLEINILFRDKYFV